MTKLAMTSGEMPQALFLENVRLEATEPVAHGSFSDIFKGYLGQTVVAVKRLRLVDVVKDVETVRIALLDH